MNQTEFYEAKLNYETDSWDLSEIMKSSDKVIVIDARSPEAYEEEHIPGAINIPHRAMTEESTMHLDRANLFVIYCDGIGCNASTKGALNMVKLGFSVKELLGGLEWWKRDGYETEGKKGLKGKSVQCGC
jgi:rhodanese-related sulfurtransferase